VSTTRGVIEVTEVSCTDHAGKDVVMRLRRPADGEVERPLVGVQEGSPLRREIPSEEPLEVRRLDVAPRCKRLADEGEVSELPTAMT
jgi:hypothetical protein